MVNKNSKSQDRIVCIGEPGVQWERDRPPVLRCEREGHTMVRVTTNVLIKSQSNKLITEYILLSSLSSLSSLASLCRTV